MLCQCKRLQNKVHCPSCGSYTCYATPSKAGKLTPAVAANATEPDGTITVMAYRCRRCGIAFNDIDRAKCEAPEFVSRPVSAERRLDDASDAVADAILSLPDDEGRQATLAELFKNVKIAQADTKTEKKHDHE